MVAHVFSVCTECRVHVHRFAHGIVWDVNVSIHIPTFANLCFYFSVHHASVPLVGLVFVDSLNREVKQGPPCSVLFGAADFAALIA